MGTRTPVHDTRHDFAGLESVYLPIAGAVFAIVTLLVVYALIRRRRARIGELGSQRKENNPLELAYAAVLVAITALLVTLTFTTEDRTDAIARGPGLEVKISAGQWSWRFSYPAYGITQQSTPARPAQLVVPTGTVVHFTGTSTDVIHSFWVPDRRFKRDLFPRNNTRFDLSWSKPGFARGECAEFCGLLHSNMDFVVDALSPSDFRAWVAAHRGAAP
jgi:cytochrome c oxidase subunit II